jgi:predicted nicotinamide N-methyase
LDFPQLYTKPSAADLLQTLERLTLEPRSFEFQHQKASTKPRLIRPTGVSRYLTSIISSSLSWLASDELREQVWDAAAARLSERSGRTGSSHYCQQKASFNFFFLGEAYILTHNLHVLAMPALSRVFQIPSSPSEQFSVTLHEPSLTADNLGMKTWVSSYLLSRQLHAIIESAPELVASRSIFPEDDHRNKVLELGAGTGLLGLSFAVLRGSAAAVHLTDLPAIVPNLAYNIDLNNELLNKAGSVVTTGVLDWSVLPSQRISEDDRYTVILTADPLYSPDHPHWLVQTIDHWLSRSLDARVIVEMPLRDAYLPQVQDFRFRMNAIGLTLVQQGKETGYDDWESIDGDSVEVHCWWSVWGWSEKI